MKWSILGKPPRYCLIAWRNSHRNARVAHTHNEIGRRRQVPLRPIHSTWGHAAKSDHNVFGVLSASSTPTVKAVYTALALQSTNKISAPEAFSGRRGHGPIGTEYAHHSKNLCPIHQIASHNNAGKFLLSHGSSFPYAHMIHSTLTHLPALFHCVSARHLPP